MILHRQLAIGRLQHLVVGGAVDFQQFVIIDVERHSSKPLLQPVTPAKAGAAVGPAAPVPRAMPACAGMTAEGQERKSVVWGTGVVLRCEVGCRRILKKKK